MGGVSKPIKIGTDDFNKIRDEGGYYIDKTVLIGDILEQKKGVYLFTRPRRFGKSLNLSMLDSYFNLRYADDPDRFAGLRISELRPNDSEKNAYPVIHISLKELKSATYESFLDVLRQKISIVYKNFPELGSSSKQDPDDARQFLRMKSGEASETELRFSLFDLTRMLEVEYGKRVILLIDEYDNIVNEAATLDARRSILEFYYIFLSEALKSNRSLEFAVLTGVMQIIMSSIFSGLNNICPYSIFDKRFQEHWGFSEDEVKKLCADFGHPEKSDEAMGWYCGYRFGDAELCNPWSVLRYVDSGFVPKEYWSETSTNSILYDLCMRADTSVLKDLIDMNGGGAVKALHSTNAYIDSDDESLYSLMVMTGYLRAVPMGGDLYEISFPNREISSTMEDVVYDTMLPSNDLEFRRLCSAGADGRTDDLESILGRIVSKNGCWNSSRDWPYPLVLMSITLGISPWYDIRAEKEGGNGRIDIIMEPKAAGRAGMIIELKKVDSETELEGAADSALSQIHEKRCYLGMRGTVLLYGISFCGKIPFVRHERLELQ